MTRGKANARRTSSKKKNARDETLELTSRNGVVVFRQPRSTTIRRSTIPIVLTKGSVDQGFGQVFELSQVINATDLTALYDQYCIDKVEYTIELATPFISNGVYPYVAVAPDYTDAIAPISITSVLELAQCKVYQFSPEKTRFSVTIKPRPAMSAYSTAVTSGYSIPNGDVWFATNDSGVDHYGLKFWLADYNTTISAITALRGFAVFHLKLRSSR